MKLKRDWFLIGMALATLLAWRFPEPGASGGWMHPALVTKAGVALIFFLHGIALSFATLKAGTLLWPLHLLVQTSTFLLFPLLGLGLITILGERVSADLKLGLFFLCALPSTVSSSVALTAAAGGNVAGALFNASLSSVLGVFITPLWVAAVVSARGESQALTPVFLDLMTWLILPLVLGQLSRPVLADVVRRNAEKVSVVDRLTILLLVYTSFCDSFAQGVWSQHGWSTLGMGDRRFARVVHRGDGAGGRGGARTALRSRRSDCGDVLRFKEDARVRRAHGAPDVWRRSGDRADPVADHDLSFAATCDLRGVGAALGDSNGG